MSKLDLHANLTNVARTTFKSLGPFEYILMVKNTKSKLTISINETSKTISKTISGKPQKSSVHPLDFNTNPQF